jgi:hypothetical protein
MESVVPTKKTEPVSSVRTGPPGRHTARPSDRRAHRTVSTRGHFCVEQRMRFGMWREVGRSAAAAGQRVPRVHVSPVRPPPNGSFRLSCCRNRITSVHSRGSSVSRWRYWIRAWDSGEPATSHSAAQAVEVRSTRMFKGGLTSQGGRPLHPGLARRRGCMTV